jgi:tetratricopeptide (TPR) repeat protein
MGRRERPVDPAGGPVPAFAHQLRELRKAAGSPSYRDLARVAHFSDTSLSVAAGGTTLPSLEVTLAYVRACGGDVTEWAERWASTASVLGLATPPGPGSPVRPAQLPCAVTEFTGRVGALDALDALLGDEDSQPASVPIAVISGAPGIGKSTLAVHWAHRVASRFPDGQLYLNLRGFGPVGQPVTAAEAIRGFLDAFEVPAARTPAGLEAQIGLYRSLLAGQRVLVVLDNAADAAQVRPLLPGSPGCAVVITSRTQPSVLVASVGAYPITLDLLTGDEARDLLASRLGRDRVAADPAATEELIELCTRLPLALGIAAARAAIRAGLPLAETAAELRDASRRLDVLDVGDAATSVRAVFSWSYQKLTAPAARMFRLLGVHPGPDISAPAAASLADLTVTKASRLLTELTGAHLVSEHAKGRFGCHDLLRTYAAELSGTADSAADQEAAKRRMLDHYLHTADRAALALNPKPIQGLPVLPEPSAGTGPEQLDSYASAWAWFEAERPVLLATLQLAASSGWDSYASLLPAMLVAYFSRRGHWHEWVGTQQTALRAAQDQGDRPGEARANSGIGRAYGWLGQYEEASPYMERALSLFDELGDRAGQAAIHIQLGGMFDRQDRPADALPHAQRALAHYRVIDNRLGQAAALNNIGWYYSLFGDHEQALTYCTEALSLFKELGDRLGEAHALDSVGYACHHLGRPAEAEATCREALALASELRAGYAEGVIYAHLGDICLAKGDADDARGQWQQAVTIFDQLGRADAAQVRAKLAALGSGPLILAL